MRAAEKIGNYFMQQHFFVKGETRTMAVRKIRHCYIESLNMAHLFDFSTMHTLCFDFFPHSR